MQKKSFFIIERMKKYRKCPALPVYNKASQPKPAWADRLERKQELLLPREEAFMGCLGYICSF